MSQPFLIYGSYGYTGDLIAHLAVRRGLRPVLGGRDEEKLRLQALALGLDHRPFSLNNLQEIYAVLQDYPLVLHCAGPFKYTSKEMVDACLQTGTHYLDINGSIPIFERLAERGREAKRAGIMILSGAGFDVAPSDCLALYLKKRLPSADHLALAFSGTRQGISQGTALTIVENLDMTGLIRCEGEIVPVPMAQEVRDVDFGQGPQKAVSIPWGDVSTAYYSTGIPNIIVYSGNVAPLRGFLILSRYFNRLLAAEWLKDYLRSRIRSRPPGPSEEQRSAGRSYVWGEVTDENGERRVSRLKGPESYTMTAEVAVAAVERVLNKDAPHGFQTPASAYGSDFIFSMDEVEWEDIE